MAPNCITLFLLYVASDLSVFFFFLSFITYRSCKHLDNKHTIFGRVVGGMETLSEMERIEVDNKDRPIEDIIILKAQIFVDPYQEADEQVFKKIKILLQFLCYFKFLVGERTRRRIAEASRRRTVEKEEIGGTEIFKSF